MTTTEKAQLAALIQEISPAVKSSALKFDFTSHYVPVITAVKLHHGTRAGLLSTKLLTPDVKLYYLFKIKRT